MEAKTQKTNRARHILLLIAVWIITLVAFSISFSIFGSSYVGKNEKGLELALILVVIFCFALFFGLIGSSPAFLLFGIAGFYVLKSTLDLRKKKYFLLLINYLGILGTCCIAYAIIYGIGERDNIFYSFKNYFLWYPNWVIIGVSTLCILLMPFEKKSVVLTNK